MIRLALAFACITTLSCIPKQPAPAPSPAHETPGDARLPTHEELFGNDEDRELEQLAADRERKEQAARDVEEWRAQERAREEQVRKDAEEIATFRNRIEEREKPDQALCKPAAGMFAQMVNQGAVVRLDANGTGPYVFIREEQLYQAVQSITGPSVTTGAALDILLGMMFVHASCIYPTETYFRIVTGQGEIVREHRKP